MIHDVTGLVTGFTGLALAAAGLLLALLAGLRLLVVGRRPGRGRWARGVAAGGLVLLLCGAALLAGEELDVLRHFTDRGAWALAAASVAVSAAAGIRAGRGRPPRVLEAPTSGEAASPEPPAARPRP